MDTISRIWKYGLLQYLFHSSRQLYDCFVPCTLKIKFNQHIIKGSQSASQDNINTKAKKQ